MRKKRLEYKLTQEGLAKVLGRSVGTIRFWESRQNRNRDVVDSVLARGIEATLKEHKKTGQVAT